MVTPGYLPFHPAPKKPAQAPPPNACDAHCHVFEPAARAYRHLIRTKSHMPDDGALVDWIMTVCDTPALRRQVLVDNPARLYWPDG